VTSSAPSATTKKRSPGSPFLTTRSFLSYVAFFSASAIFARDGSSSARNALTLFTSSRLNARAAVSRARLTVT
jgi:hypothetical protein